MRTTTWFNCVSEPPVRVGWYDFRVNDSSADHCCWWDGASWHMARPDGMLIDTRLVFGDRSQWRGQFKAV